MNGGKKSIWEVWKVLWDITENGEREKKDRKQDENKRQIRCYGYDAGKYGDADLKLCIAVDVGKCISTVLYGGRYGHCGKSAWSGCVGSTRHSRVVKLAGSGDHSGNHPGLWHPCFPAVWGKKRGGASGNYFSCVLSGSSGSDFIYRRYFDRITWFGRDFTGAC